MLKSRLLRLAIALCAVALVCLLVCPRPAAADDILTISFTGTTGPCDNTNPFHPIVCSSIPANTAVTGTYSFDETTGSIVGPWSFSTFFASISSSTYGATDFVSLPNSQNGGGYTLTFRAYSGSSPVIISLTFSSPDGYGTILTGPLSTAPNPTDFSGPSEVVEYTFDEGYFGHTTLDITSGQASVVAATPEPATLLLLGTGLLAFAPLIRRHFGHSGV